LADLAKFLTIFQAFAPASLSRVLSDLIV